MVLTVRLKIESLAILHRINCQAENRIASDSIFGFESFLLGKKVKKSFKVLSTGLRYLVFGCTMITCCLYPNSGNVHSSYCRNLQIFPEVDLDQKGGLDFGFGSNFNYWLAYFSITFQLI